MSTIGANKVLILGGSDANGELLSDGFVFDTEAA